MHGHAVAEAREGGEEASIVTTGLDVFKPYKSAAHRWCIDAKASASNTARLRSHPRRLRPRLAQTARHQAQHRGCGGATTNARSMIVANTPDRGCSPWPSWCSK